MKKTEEIDIYLEIKKLGFTPNEYFYLILLDKGVTNLSNFNVEDVHKTLTAKGFEDLNEAILKTKKVDPLKDLDEFVDEYRKIFPKGMLPSGRAAKSTPVEVKAKMKWFLTNFEYTKEQVLDTTRKYVQDYASKDYLYMQTASFFIYKDDVNKVRTSNLAERCENEDEVEIPSFGIDA